jgi:hypothetical protein
MHQSNTSMRDMVQCAKPGAFISKGITINDKRTDREWVITSMAQNQTTNHQSRSWHLPNVWK